MVRRSPWQPLRKGWLQVFGTESDFDLETNDNSNLTELLAVTHSATDKATYLEVIGKHIGTDRMLKFIAVEGVVRRFDVMHRRDNGNHAISSSILFRRCLASPMAKSAYKSAIHEVIEIWESLEMVSAARRHHNQIRHYVYKDERRKTEQHGALTNKQFGEAYRQLLLTIGDRVPAVRSDLLGN